MKRNIDLTIDGDFGGAHNRFVSDMRDHIDRIEKQYLISENERLTGIFTGTQEQIKEKRKRLELEKKIDCSCHRCGKLLNAQNTMSLCVKCDRELEIQVLGEL